MRVLSISSSWKSISLLAAAVIISTYAQRPVQSGMTADSYCKKSFCVTALYVPQSNQIMYTLVVPSNGPAVGWYGIGQGEGMKGANMAINWANADGTLTTSHRSARGESYPTEELALSLPKMMLDSQMSSTTSTQTVWSWFFAQDSGPSKMSHIYAYSPRTPASSNSSGGIGMHIDDDTFTLDMTKPYTGRAAAGLDGVFSTTLSSSAQRDLSQAKTRLYLAHMILMIFGWMLFVPVGIFVARFGRGKYTWFPAHRSIQGFSYVIIIIAAILAAVAMRKEQSGHSLGKHAKSGLGVLILFLIQAGLGSFTHYYRAKTGRRWFGYVHMPLGIIIVAASVYTINLGFKAWKWNAPNAARYFIFAWAAILACIYIAGMLLIPRQRKLEQAKAVQEHIDKSSTEMDEVKQV